ncbi:serine threonine protein kinase [Stylonychia lemnae]|uniref:Serine threonine protein kinase n=1 Tax=Stylonychia lemnae TaxID=5949 RepID=A0A078BAP9_STYLE|nr:serine threonine protein kinase [Stylonychia lemnae]|eukprot:CDW90327.1 serine threonine protein kinase [Stylonychia lemnae]
MSTNESFTQNQTKIKASLFLDINLCYYRKCSRMIITQEKEPKSYDLVKIIGSGGNAVVKLAQKYKSGIENNPRQLKQIAIKQIKKSSLLKDKVAINQLKVEIEVHRKLQNCANILGLYKVYESNNNVYLFLEYQEGGTLMNILKNSKEMIEKDLQIIMGQLILATDYMHQMGIIHRDLKPQNILLNSKEKKNLDLRIADFGLSCIYNNAKKPSEKCGTPTYIGPEMLKSSRYDYKVDIFSLGSIMYNLVTGRYLFQSKKNDNILHLNMQCNLDHIDKYISSLTYEGRDLLKKLLEKDPLLRPNAKQALKHPWFQADREALDVALVINEQIQNLTYQKKFNISSSQLNQESGAQSSHYNNENQRGSSHHQ